MRKALWGSLVAFAVAALTAAPAAAQDKIDVGVGYQYQHWSQDVGSFPLGFNFDVAGRIRPNLSWVGQIDWSHHSNSLTFLGTSIEEKINATSFGGGVRWSPTSANPSLSPFVQFVVGATHSSFSDSAAGVEVDSDSSTDAMIQIGGGVAFPIKKNLAGVGQLDYRRIFAESEGINAFRIMVGIRWMMK